MLHSTEATWTSSGEGYAGLAGSARLDRQMATTKNAIAVSSLQTTALYEHQAKPQLTATMLSPVHSGPSQSSSTLYTMDTAVMGLAMVGAWMVVLGGAMLSRRLGQMKATTLQQQ